MANGYQTNILTKSYRGIQVFSLRTIGKFGGCRQIPTHKIVSGSKLCCHNGGIWAKCADIWLSWQHVADMLATFSAKIEVRPNVSPYWVLIVLFLLYLLRCFLKHHRLFFYFTT